MQPSRHGPDGRISKGEVRVDEHGVEQQVNTATAGRMPGQIGPWQEIVNVARWAPSVHNTQAWRVRPVNETQAELCYIPSRLLARTDANGMFYTIAMGIFVEALDIAAGAHGQTIRLLDLVPGLEASESDEPRTFGRLELQSRSDEPAFAAELLRTRRTSRIPYNGIPIDEDATSQLLRVGTSDGQRIAFTSDAELVRWMVGLNIDTLFHDLRHLPAREEIGIWIRKSGREARTQRDGFSPRCLGFNGRLLAGFFSHHRLFDQPIVRNIIRATYARAYKGTASAGWITAPMHTPDDWFAAGRTLLRTWLTATRLGLVLHPFGSVITNPTAHALMEERLPSEANGDVTWLLFRIGRSAVPPRSLRLPTTEVLL